MTITPVEIHHVRLGRGLLGYRRRAVDELLDQIAVSYEDAWRGRANLEDHVERLEAELARFRELERLLRDTMVSAERAAESLRADARREYDLLVQEARLKAREIVGGAESERDGVLADVRRLEAVRSEARARIEAALERLETGPEQPGDLEDTGELARPWQAA